MLPVTTDQDYAQMPERMVHGLTMYSLHTVHGMHCIQSVLATIMIISGEGRALGKLPVHTGNLLVFLLFVPINIVASC